MQNLKCMFFSLNQVEPLVQGALSALNLGKKAFRFTRINLGQVKPKITNLRSELIHFYHGITNVFYVFYTLQSS